MSYGFNDDFKLKIHLRKRTPKRTVMKHSADEIWNYLRNNGVAKVVQDGTTFKFYTINEEIISPMGLYNRLTVVLKRQKNENWGKPDFTKPLKSNWVTGEKTPQLGPYDRELHNSLNAKITEIVDYFIDWDLLAEKVRLKLVKIPTDLQLQDDSDTLPQLKNNSDLASQKASRKKWNGSKGDFVQHVWEQYDVDKVKPQNEKFYKDLKDACFKIFAQYKFKTHWKWTPDKCYKYTLKINST